MPPDLCEAMSHAVENDSAGTGKLLFKLTRESDGIFYHTANAATIAAHVFRAAICRHGSRKKMTALAFLPYGERRDSERPVFQGREHVGMAQNKAQG